MRSRLIPSAIVALFCLAGSSSVCQQGPGALVTPTETKPLTSLPKAVLDAELISADGGSFRLSDYSGKVLVLTLWATWCGPCRSETAVLVELHKRFKLEGVEIVELSTENPEASAEDVRDWVRHYGVYYKVGWATPDLWLTLMQGRDAIPQVFVVSRSGRIIKRFVGFDPKTTPLMFKQAVRDALNEKSDLPEHN